MVRQSGANILIIDDEPAICELIKEALEKIGLHCTVAVTASHVEQLLQQQGFDIVISDINMPGRNGLDILHDITEMSPSTKTILITGRRRSDWARRALHEGAFDYIEKPFDIDTIHDVVQKALHLQQKEQFRQDPRQAIHRRLTVLTDKHGEVRYVSETYAAMMGASPLAAIGKLFDELFQSSASMFAELVQQTAVVGKVVANFKRQPDGSFPAEVIVEPVEVGQQHLFLLRLTDISPLEVSWNPARAAANQIYGRIGHDPLTGLPNHSSFQEELSRVRGTCRRHGRSVTVVLVNLDDLRQLNALHGFDGGDIIMIELAQLIRQQVRMSDYVARYSGDQVAVILPETDGRHAMISIKRLMQTIAEHEFQVDGRFVQVTMSVGMAECQSCFIENQDELLANAEKALTAARHKVEDKVVLWQPRSATSMRSSLVHNAKQMIAEIPRADRESHLALARSLAAAVEAKDAYTKDHSLNVAEYAEFFALQLGLKGEDVSIIRCGAILHDVGKIGIPDAVLLKPSRLTDEEFELIKRHPIIGSEIVRQSNFLEEEAELIRHHHERYDGRGYPDGLCGDELTVGARILQVADSLDTMICARLYKKGYELDHVINELTTHSGAQFDPEIAQIAIDMLLKHPERIRFPKRKVISV